MVRGLLLAGGAATRFGAAKLLHPFEDGLAMGAVSARNLILGVGNALAVVREGDTALAARLRDAGCEVLETPRSRDGLGASLAAGVDASRESEGWIVALGDMPRIAPATLGAVAQAIRDGAPIAAPRLASGERGHPVGFGAELREELLALAGDEGARSVIGRHATRVRLIDVTDAGILYDIDTPRDLPRP